MKLNTLLLFLTNCYLFDQLRAGLVENRMLWHVKNDSFFHPPARSAREFPSDIHREDKPWWSTVMELLEITLTKVLLPLPEFTSWVPLETLALRIVHAEPLAIHQLQFRFPALVCGGSWSDNLWFSVPSYLSLPLMDVKRVDFSSLFDFILVKMEGQLPSSFHMGWAPEAHTVSCF